MSQLLSNGLFPGLLMNVGALIIDHLGGVGCKIALRKADRAEATARRDKLVNGEARETSDCHPL